MTKEEKPEEEIPIPRPDGESIKIDLEELRKNCLKAYSDYLEKGKGEIKA